MIVELCNLTPELNVSEKHREAIALCQFILIDLLIDDEELRNELLDVVAMYESSIEKREKRLIKEAEEKGREKAEKVNAEMKEMLMEVVDNLDEDGKLNPVTFKKLLAVTSKF